ncbi:hypothetical protein MHYP_G00337480 [Metynnis hypsauchen]
MSFGMALQRRPLPSPRTPDCGKRILDMSDRTQAVHNTEKSIGCEGCPLPQCSRMGELAQSRSASGTPTASCCHLSLDQAEDELRPSYVRQLLRREKSSHRYSACGDDSVKASKPESGG